MRAIDADAFKEYITDACEDMKHLFNDGGAVAKLITESFCKDIDEQPTIQPEPKRGKWIRVGSGSLYDNYKCSECGKQPKWDCMGDNRWKIAFTDFCPNCGADMRTKETDYERAVEQLYHDTLYEPTFNRNDGSM